MILTDEKKLERIDISLLAIEAAEELTRLNKGLNTDFKSMKTLAEIINSSFSENTGGHYYRLDHASLVSSAILNSNQSTTSTKTLKEIANDAIKISNQLNSENISTEGENIQKLISFCVALSDSAALYKEELQEIQKHFA